MKAFKFFFFANSKDLFSIHFLSSLFSAEMYRFCYFNILCKTFDINLDNEEQLKDCVYNLSVLSLHVAYCNSLMNKVIENRR